MAKLFNLETYNKIVISCKWGLIWRPNPQQGRNCSANLTMWICYKAGKVVKLNELHNKGTEYKSPPICPPSVILVLHPCSAASLANTHTTPFLLRMVLALCPSVGWLTLLEGAMEGIAAPDLAAYCQTYFTSYTHFHFQYWPNSVAKSHPLMTSSTAAGTVASGQGSHLSGTLWP